MCPVSTNVRLTILRDRAHMLAEARSFFKERGVIEVDCPLLTQKASVDAHIDLIPALFDGKEKRYLHSSPEYGMKRLLAEGLGDCYQLAHVFRDGEYGAKHNPEFTLVEWYRLGNAFETFISETVNFLRLFLGELPTEVLTYRALFLKNLQLDPFTSTERELIHYLETHRIPMYPLLIDEGKDALLNLLLGTLIEPALGHNSLFVLTDYPASQAALAKTKVVDGQKVACRFEVYYKGVELANGYDELADPLEQRKRFNEANALRLALGKEELPIDEAFLQALQDFPACCGVAVGFDRLMMLRHQVSALKDVLPFDWSTA
jgi:lysyl-tRNA synthetase class 2